MAEQLVLDLQFRAALGRDDFLVAPCNALAVALIDRWPRWPGPALALFGPAGCGKTHLAHVFATRAGARVLESADLNGDADPLDLFEPAGAAVVVEDADRLLARRMISETGLFHLLNAARQRGGWLLVTGEAPPARWPVALKDLRSRLAALPSAELEEADDSLLSAVVLKLFADRGLDVAPGAIAYLIPRMERRFAAIQSLVDEADRAALTRGRAVTVAVLKDVLQARRGAGDRASFKSD